MGHRHKARRLALQFLYLIDSTGEGLETALERFKSAFGLDPKLAEFFMRLIKGVTDKMEDLDGIIESRSHNWRLARMSRVDRNILRLAVFEMTFSRDVPDKVAINEAIELAKDFGTEESGSFINGILDSIRHNGPAPKEPLSDANGNPKES